MSKSEGDDPNDGSSRALETKSMPMPVDIGTALDPTTDGVVLLMRGAPVMLDARVAAAFGVETRAVNQAVSRNPQKFDERHRFQITEAERAFLTSQDVISKPGRGGSRTLPYVFTQKGVARLATVLDTPTALQATDMMIDLCTRIYQQIAHGRTDVTIENPGRHLPDEALLQQLNGLREKAIKAIADLLDTPVSTKSRMTIGDEIGAVAGSALDMLKAHLKSKSIENEKVAAETLLVLEKAREVRDRTQADVEKTHAETERITLDNMEKRLSIAEKAWNLVQKMEPNAVAAMNRTFVQPRLLISVPSETNLDRLTGPLA